jgi:nifR3 family TIM-barrel protein
VVTEFIAAEGLTRDNARTFRMLGFEACEKPLSVQIFGADVERMVRAASMVADAGADIVDINCGCPAPKVVRRGGGAELMRQADRLRAILKGIRAAVRIPVTVKIRAGWDADHINALEIATMVEGEGAAMLALHARTRVQLYSGLADWDLVRRVKEKLSIPVLGSGDVTGPATALARLASGACDGVMIGRGALDNPWTFAQIADVDSGRAPRQPSPEDRVWALRFFREALEETLPVNAFLGRLRGMACRFVKGMEGGAAARRVLGVARSVDEVERVFAQFVLGRVRGIDLERAVA